MMILMHEETMLGSLLEKRFLHSYKGLCGGNVPLVNTSVTRW